jgi:hypothetical protein
MESPPGPAGLDEREAEQIHEVVPARAVLTELARGFLLVHETNPMAAVRFAETFLREQTGRHPGSRAEAEPRPTRARLALGRFPRGAVEPPVSPKSPGSI